MAGIQNLKEVLICGADLANLGVALSDGVDLSDFAYLIPLSQSVVPAIQDISQVPPEASEIDISEAQELQEAFEQRFIIPSGKTEEFIEDSISVFITGNKQMSFFMYIDKWFIKAGIKKR